MALSYADSSALMADPDFRGRVKVACLKFATYIMDEASNVPAHSTRIKWAQNTMVNPDAAAALVTPETVMDAKVQESGAEISDADLQSSVETSINKMM